MSAERLLDKSDYFNMISFKDKSVASILYFRCVFSC